MDESSFDSLLFELLGVRPTRVSSSACPKCGATLTEISRTGKAGCGACYHTFAPQLLPYIQRVHVRVEHVGKIPKGAGEAIARRRKIASLEQSLSEAVSKQEFEQAAHIRDEIKKLREDGGGQK